MIENNPLEQLFELANHYPSPHNGQPIELKQQDEQHFTLHFQRERGLQAVDISYLFSYVTMGVFIQHLAFCAEALGHDFTYSLALPPLETIKGTGSVQFASCEIRLSQKPTNQTLVDILANRQTSRKKYTQGIDDELTQQLLAIATDNHSELHKMKQEGTRQAIWLNQRAVFDDMFDNAVRKELNHWLRYSKQEKEASRDGLAYDCMELNGAVMKFIIKHYKILRTPGISWLIEKYYLRTMTDNSDVFYLLAPFSNEYESFTVGMSIMKMWHAIAAKGYYLHPFGTIMSNQAAHADFLKLINSDHEDMSQNFLVFIFRGGMSEKPHASLRIPVKDHLFRR
ncbi:MAG TPA: hypothetical protein VF281_00665 [Candidatus Saccharimonadales bacterium]